MKGEFRPLLGVDSPSVCHNISCRQETDSLFITGGPATVRVACIGGGPGGLFFATLLRHHDATHEVTVFERNRAEDTFGFGVVFSDATLAGIFDADPMLRTALDDHGVHWDPIELRLHGQRIRCEGNGMAAIERHTLLRVLQEKALEVEVDVRFQTAVDADELRGQGFDLIVASDGANSRTRARFEEAFGPQVEVATAKFIWFGTTYPFEGLTFVHERGEDGVFAVHGYPIGNGRSTFIVETNEESWRSAGLDEFDVSQPPGASDEKSKAYLEKLFAEQIDGAPLLTNNSRWGNFRTLRTRSWSATTSEGTPVVLLGDAAHTAHFSVGSGTKMALEDAITLAAALDADTDVDAALAIYEERRRPLVAKIQDSAGPSLSWWEHFGRTHDALPPWQFAYHFFTRSMTDSRLRRRAPRFVESIHGIWRREHGADPLHTPFRFGDRRTQGRMVALTDRRGILHLTVGSSDLPLLSSRPHESDWGLWLDAPMSHEELDQPRRILAYEATGGAQVVTIAGGSSLTRRLLAEEARFTHKLPVVLVQDSDPDAATTAVLSGRADLIAFRRSQPLEGEA